MTLYKFLAYGAYYEYQVRREDGNRKKPALYFSSERRLHSK